MTVNLESLLVTNAAGMVKTPEEARKLLKSAVTRITIGSITMEPREGNLGETYYYSPSTGTAWNSLGLPNPGVEATVGWLGQFHKECHDHGKELAVSIAGFKPSEYGKLAGRVMPYVDVLEANAGCGNMWRNNVQKPIPSYDPDLLEEVLAYIGTEADGCDVKYSPVMDPELRRRGANVMSGSGLVRHIIAVNTLPNQEGKRDEGGKALRWRESEDADEKYTGGLSGEALRDDGLEVVSALSLLLPEIPIIGCGGIRVGEDALSYLNCRAKGFAIGTEFFERGPGVFSDVLAELVAEMEQ